MVPYRPQRSTRPGAVTRRNAVLIARQRLAELARTLDETGQRGAAVAAENIRQLLDFAR